MKLWHYTTAMAFCGSVFLAGCGSESLAPPPFLPFPGATSVPGSASAALTIPPGVDLVARDFGFSFINPRIANVALRDGNSGTASGSAVGRLFSQGEFTSLAFSSPFNISVNAIAANDAVIVGNLNTSAVTFPTINSPLRVGSRFALENGSFEIIVDSISRTGAGAITEGEEITIGGRVTRIGEVNLQNQATGDNLNEIVTLDTGIFRGSFVAELGALCELDTSPSSTTVPRSLYEVIVRVNPAAAAVVGQTVEIRVTRTRANGNPAIATLTGIVPTSGEVRLDIRDIYTQVGDNATTDTVFDPGPILPGTPDLNVNPVIAAQENPGRSDVIRIVSSPGDICSGVSEITRTLQ